MERRLVKIVGKKDVPGKPMMYGKTTEFLQYFGPGRTFPPRRRSRSSGSSRRAKRP